MKGFFNHIDHEWAVRFIESRIKDPNIIRLVRRMLNAGVVEDFRYEETEEGSGQGSVCSPVIANIYIVQSMEHIFCEGRKRDRDNEKYEKTCEVRREAGRKDGRPPKLAADNENDGFMKNQKVSENDSEHVPSRFSDFVKAYPGKMPDQLSDSVQERYRQVVAKGYREGDLISAAENYAEAVRIEEREARCIKRPDNFLASGMFEEYLPGAYVRSEPGRKNQTAADRHHAGMRERIRLSGSRLRVKIGYPVKSTRDEISSYHIACSPVFRMDFPYQPTRARHGAVNESEGHMAK